MVPLAGRGAVDGGVVADHQLAVGGGVHVELDRRGTRLERVLDGVQRGGGRLPRAALVRVGDHPALEPAPTLAHRPDGNSRRLAGPRPRRARPRALTGAGLSSCRVLDHLLVDVIGTIRASFDRALLQRQAVEERFQVDVFLGRRLLGDLLQPARRGAAAPGAGRRLGRLAHLEPDLLPQLVDRRAARRAPRGRDRGGAAGPAHGRGARHREGPGGPAADRVRWATRWTWSARPPRSSRCTPTTHGDDGAGGVRRGCGWAVEATYEGSLRFSDAATRGPSALARLRRPDPLDRLHADRAGRSALHLPAPRGGRRLTASPRHRARAPWSLARPRARRAAAPPAAPPRPAAPPAEPGAGARPPHAPARRAGRPGGAVGVPGRPARQGRRAGALPLALPGRVSARHRRLHRAAARPARRRAGRRVVFVEATVDPGRDTVARLAAYQQGVRRRLGAVDRHAATRWPPSGSPSVCSTRSCPRVSRPRPTGGPAQPLTYDVEHTDGYILIDAPAASASSTPARPNMRGRLDPKLAGLLDDGGVARPRQPARAQLDHGRRAGRHRLAPRHRRPRRRARERQRGCAAPPGPVPAPRGRSRRPGPPDRVRRRRRDHAVVPAHDRQLAHPHPPALPGRADPGHRGRRHPVRLRPRHADATAPASTTAASFQWPPLVQSRAGHAWARASTRSLVGTLRRPDGSTQISYGGHPLYTYNLDVVARRGDGPGHRPGRGAVVRDRRPGPAGHHRVLRDSPSLNVPAPSRVPRPEVTC